MTGGADAVWRSAVSELIGQVMMVVGLPMPGRMVWGDAVAGTLANVNDEDDHADHPRRGWSRSLGWVSRA
jgi:hypothetical protein